MYRVALEDSAPKIFLTLVVYISGHFLKLALNVGGLFLPTASAWHPTCVPQRRLLQGIGRHQKSRRWSQRFNKVKVADIMPRCAPTIA